MDSPVPFRGPSTRAVHAGELSRDPRSPIVNPIFQTTTFFSEPEGEGEVLYTRYGNNPGQRALEQRIAALEGAGDALMLGSGMAANAAALLACVQAGDHVVAARALYGGTRTLLERELPRLGIETTFVDLHTEGWQEALRPETRALLLEVPANPLMRVVDFPRVVEIARGRGVPVLVDATFATPVNFRALEHGAELVIHSATKYLGGHSDVTAGVIAGGRERVETARGRALSFGAALDPHAAWLVERGMKTLAIRMERHNRNGMVVAEWCEGRPGITRVHYPGLASHPDHQAARRLLDGFGGMVAIELAGGGESAARFVGALRIAKVAPSLGGVETLVSEPRHTSHVGLGAEERERLGIRDGLVRFSLGIEDAEDILADIEQALHAARGA
jgi:cystathionine beta-lyase/cystathionine gamma-synthase